MSKEPLDVRNNYCMGWAMSYRFFFHEIKTNKKLKSKLNNNIYTLLLLLLF